MFADFSERYAIGFAADRVPDRDLYRYSWTLPTALGHFLTLAERRFGPRDKEWTILGVEFGPDAYPKTWQPSRRHVVVQLSDCARQDPSTALTELAHEVIHLLSPGAHRVTILEEGVATLFAQEMTREFGLNPAPSMPAYDAAAAMVWQLYHRGAIATIRDVQPDWANVTPEIIRYLCPAISPLMARTLCRDFRRDEAVMQLSEEERAAARASASKARLDEVKWLRQVARDEAAQDLAQA